MRPVGQEMVFGILVDDLRQSLAEFPIQKAHDLAHTLKGEPLAPQFADDGQFRQMPGVVEPAMPLALGLHHAALIPPLQLPRSDAGQRNYFAGCEPILHVRLDMFETSTMQNVSDILGMRPCGSSKEKAGVSD